MVKQHSQEVRLGINLRHTHKIQACYDIHATHPAKMSPHHLLVYDKHSGRLSQIYFLLGVERPGFPYLMRIRGEY
jgi:hypothetical protein